MGEFIIIIVVIVVVVMSHTAITGQPVGSKGKYHLIAHAGDMTLHAFVHQLCVTEHLGW